MSKLNKYKFNELYAMGSGISSKPEQAGHGAPFVSFRTVFNNYFLPNALVDLMDTSEQEQEKYSIKKGDILLTRTSETIDELGMSCVAVKDYPKATFSGFVKRLRPKQNDITYDKYMAFYLRSKHFRKAITNNAFMTLRASLNEDIFSYLNLYLPDYETQKNIGDFLFLLNSKIELNTRINAELEAMAKTLYDYWFVQFDFPFDFAQGRPNADGKPYKSSGGAMVWNAALKREIPAGWEVGELGDVFSLEYGKPLKEKERSGSGYPVVGSNGIVGYHHEFLVEGPGIVVGRKGTAGAVVWVENNFYPIDTTFYVKDKLGVNNLFFHYLLLLRSKFKQVESSSAVPGLNRNFVYSIKVAIPETATIQNFNQIVESSFSKMKICNKENHTLAALRDWLLPLLMNGQASVE